MFCKSLQHHHAKIIKFVQNPSGAPQKTKRTPLHRRVRQVSRDWSPAVGLSVLESRLIRYGEFLATLCPACSQHLATVGRRHSLTETVFVDSLPARRLVGSFHCHSYLVFIVLLPCSLRVCYRVLRIMRSAKVKSFFQFAKKYCNYRLRPGAAIFHIIMDDLLFPNYFS